MMPQVESSGNASKEDHEVALDRICSRVGALDIARQSATCGRDARTAGRRSAEAVTRRGAAGTAHAARNALIAGVEKNALASAAKQLTDRMQRFDAIRDAFQHGQNWHAQEKTPAAPHPSEEKHADENG